MESALETFGSPVAPRQAEGGSIRAMPLLLHPPRASWLLAGMVATLLASTATGFQEESTPAPTSPVKRRIAPEGSSGRIRPPLLREGGYLVRTPGEVTEDSTLGVHRFQPLLVEEGGVRRELILLPSRAMDDLLHLLKEHDEKNTSGSTVFEVTGKVLEYRGRNFLLPETVAAMSKPAAEVREELKPDAIGAAPAEEEMPVETDPDALAKSIEEQLEQRIGAVPRSVDIAKTPQRVDGTAPAHRAGTHLQSRRGHLLRDSSSGTWRFVFEGSAVTMELLPCKQLERMETTTRRQVVPRAVIVSGLVTTFHGRNFLLPTEFRAATEGRGIGP